MQVLGLDPDRGTPFDNHNKGTKVQREETKGSTPGEQKRVWFGWRAHLIEEVVKNQTGKVR